ncbi:MAG: hypothetical protein LUG96_09920 [Tannerellaceae bacterium]|nr:hypothetical protein [Tannerellaceae bacterium]
MERLVYWKEFISSHKDKSEFKKGFRLCQPDTGDYLEATTVNHHHLLFVLEGKIEVRCNQFSVREISSNHCILIPKSAFIEIQAVERSKVVDFSFDVLTNICKKDLFQQCNAYYREPEYDFIPVFLHPPITRFIEQLEYYFQNGLDCETFQELKEREFFFLLTNYYTREEVATLLYPLLGGTNFKNFILTHYKMCKIICNLPSVWKNGQEKCLYGKEL